MRGASTRKSRRAILLTVLLWTGASASARADPVDFARDIQPIFSSKCARCHGPKKQEGGLRLDVRRRAFAGGDVGPAVVARKVKESEVIKRILDEGEHRMPPSGPRLHAAQIDLIRRWIEEGAIWPDELAGNESIAHWAYQPIQRVEAPKVARKDRIRNAVDAFILASLEKEGRTLSADAPRATLLRRITLDLIGLPPSLKELDSFLGDTRADAYERVVDSLLKSPHFGERWGRHWLDLARYAESDGYENDRVRASAWIYRDWVVDAINRDMPFDQFTVAQLAGDLLPEATNEQKVATGLHRNTLWNSAASADKEEFRTRAIKDRTDTTATVWMGLTSGCAQCHSHKYDPLTQREYYQLYAFFNNTDEQELAVAAGKAPVIRENKRASFVHKRGNFLQKGAEVEPGTPVFLPPLAPRGKHADRLDLARWLTAPHHPLTARVAVNHLWQHLFGQGLVATPENFGLKGDAPSHPQLLDWLATEFVRLKWSRKELLRTIVLSTTYRQSSTIDAKLARADPDNRLLGRQNRFRVEAEIVRDLALSASGLLDRKIGGPSIVPPFPEGFLSSRFTSEALKMPTKERHRRGIYVHVQRTLPHPSLAVFDGVDGNQSCPRRDRSATPLQALTLLNDPNFVECAVALANRVRAERKEVDGRLNFLFRTCLSRLPSKAEHEVLKRLIDRQRALGARDEEVWRGVARTVMNLEEFTTRE